MRILQGKRSAVRVTWEGPYNNQSWLARYVLREDKMNKMKRMNAPAVEHMVTPVRWRYHLRKAL